MCDLVGASPGATTTVVDPRPHDAHLTRDDHDLVATRLALLPPMPAELSHTLHHDAVAIENTLTKTDRNAFDRDEGLELSGEA